MGAILINNARLNDLRAHLDARFNDGKDTWRGELRRDEEVIDARLNLLHYLRRHHQGCRYRPYWLCYDDFRSFARVDIGIDADVP